MFSDLEIKSLEDRLFRTFLEISFNVVGHKSITLFSDYNFLKIPSNRPNDIHAFFEMSKDYFHLRAMVNHMVESQRIDQVFLTAYRKEDINKYGGRHSLRMSWYKIDPVDISTAIATENPDIFQIKDAVIS